MKLATFVHGCTVQRVGALVQGGRRVVDLQVAQFSSASCCRSRACSRPAIRSATTAVMSDIAQMSVRRNASVRIRESIKSGVPKVLAY